MPAPFISSTIFRTYLNLLMKLIDLPTTVMLNVGGKAQECTVFHRMILSDYGQTDSIFPAKLTVHSYAISEDNLAERAQLIAAATPESITSIDPEFEFNRNGIFWAGNPVKIFKDYSPLLDKKFGKLSWCASYERDLSYPTFLVNVDEPLLESTYTLAMLDRMSTPDEKRTFVGTVEEDGSITPPKGLTNTLNDAFKDTPPVGAVPSFLRTAVIPGESATAIVRNGEKAGVTPAPDSLTTVATSKVASMLARVLSTDHRGIQPI